MLLDSVVLLDVLYVVVVDLVVDLEVAKVVVDHMAEKVEDEVEAVEMSADILGELMTRLSAIEEKFDTLEETPSNNGVNITPTNLKKETVDLGKMSVSERVKHLMNN